MVIEIEDRVPKAGRRPIISDNADLEVTFVFDEEWNGLEKVARFVLEDKTYKDVLLQDDKCMIPLEVCRPGHLLIGVIGGDIVTTSIDVLVQPSIIAKSGELLDDVEPDILTQILKFLKSSNTKPDYEGLPGERVWNANASKGEPAGWVYCDGEWIGFGIIGASLDVTDPEELNGTSVCTSDGYVLLTSDGYQVTVPKEGEGYE